MNIFYLDHDPVTCARYHCDKHVVKMILEYAQLLSTTHHIQGSGNPTLYKPTHVNHPCAVWVRQSSNHYSWLYQLFICCLDEYTRRYGKVHATNRLRTPLTPIPCNLEPLRWQEPPMAMPDDCKIVNDSVNSYRNYYRMHKANIARWKAPSVVPDWFR